MRVSASLAARLTTCNLTLPISLFHLGLNWELVNLGHKPRNISYSNRSNITKAPEIEVAIIEIAQCIHSIPRLVLTVAEVKAIICGVQQLQW